MAGRIINVAPRQTYSAALAVGAAVTIPIGARAYATTDIVSGTLSVRVSTLTSFPVAGSTVKVQVFNAMVTPEEPNVIFMPGAVPATAALASVTITSGDTIPNLYTAGWLTGTGLMLFVQLVFTNGGAGPSTMSLVGAVDLVLRDA